MATLMPSEQTTSHHGGGSGKQSIVDDFMYGTNVAGSHVYIRMGFLRKVFGIVSAQLLLTTVVGVLFMAHEPTKLFVRSNQWMLVLAFILTIGLIIPLHLKSREIPTNFILLFLFTLVQSYTVGVVVTFYDVSVVLEAFVLTCGVTVALTVYTLQSKRDFSSWGAGLFSVLWILILAGFMQIFFQSPMLDKAISVAGAVIFSLFIVFDVHMIMHKVSAEEYIVAAINLYLDIINLFLYMLRILGEARK